MTPDEKAAAIIAADVVGEYDFEDYHIEVQSITQIPEGVRIFARAWQGSEPVGFGTDGSVEIERFNFINPPVMVPDGTTRTTERSHGRRK